MKKALVIIFSLVLIFGFNLSLFGSAKAADLTAISDVMSRMQKNTDANHTITFTTPTGVAAAGTIVVTFMTSFVGATGIDYTDVDVTDNGSELTLAAAPNIATWGAIFSDDSGGTNNKLTITSGTGTITGGHVVVIEIGTNAASGDKQVKNPVEGGTENINITCGASDSGVIQVAILDDDQISINADVNPTVSFSISAASADLGTMTTSSVADTDAITLTMSTNAGTGYTVTVADEGSGAAAGLYKSSTPAKLIASSTATLAGGTEGYGAQGASTTETVAAAYLKTSNDVGALSRTAQTFVSKTSAVSAVTATIVLKAAVAGSTPPGTYADTLTLVCTGNF